MREYVHQRAFLPSPVANPTVRPRPRGQPLPRLQMSCDRAHPSGRPGMQRRGQKVLQRASAQQSAVPLPDCRMRGKDRRAQSHAIHEVRPGVSARDGAAH
ncbi:hypothetical protein NDU88_011134 [Pleurodeles waltl]|uniref:Uncharacterized protein n=1 Tax=Pleurodeles waltl TaxID=8319 RepID=A0AAV7QXY2_PLEWA|nr:hypothetical protein NDU88_011134 [Pleurodeles waltl]